MSTNKKQGDPMSIDKNNVLEKAMQPVAKAQESLREATEKGISEVKTHYDSLKTLGDGNSKALTESFEAASKGFSELNAKALAAIQSNTTAAFEFASAFFSARTISEAVEIQTQHARKQMEQLTAQSKDFAALAQKIGTSVSEPMKKVKSPVTK